MLNGKHVNEKGIVIFSKKNCKSGKITVNYFPNFGIFSVMQGRNLKST